MRLCSLPLPALIRPYIHHFWIFEADGGLPATDQRLVAPNGRPKLIVTYRNGLSTHSQASVTTTAEGKISLIGVWDRSTILSSAEAPTVTIGVEFTPNGLCRFFGSDLARLTNQIVAADDLLGAAGARLTARVMEAPDAVTAARQVSDFLVERFLSCDVRQARVIDHAIRRFRQTGYRMDIGALADEIGCSRRTLQALFTSHVGLTPKRLQSVLGFSRLYTVFARSGDPSLLRDEALDIYYDQPHFIRNFRAYTGHSPGRFAELMNEFGQIFYRSAPPQP